MSLTIQTQATILYLYRLLLYYYSRIINQGALIQYPPNEIHCFKPFSRIPALQSVMNSGAYNMSAILQYRTMPH